MPIGHRGGRVWVALRLGPATRVLYANPPDWPQMLVWERCLHPGDLFIDAGANVGTYSILCASLGAKVIAIEPAPDTIALLRENSQLNGDILDIREQAVGSHEGSITFTVGLGDVNHVAPNGGMVVPMTTLDAIIGTRMVAGLKIDIEGYELEALQGAARALRDHRIRVLQIEWNHLAPREPIARLLADNGYSLFAPTPTTCDDVFAAVGDDIPALLQPVSPSGVMMQP